MTEMVPRRIWLSTGAALLTLAIAGHVGVAAGAPTMWSPLPALTLLPSLGVLVGIGESTPVRWIVEFILPACVGPILLVAWHPKLLVGVSRVPARSVAGLAVLSLLTFLDFWVEWTQGVRYHGETYVTGVFVVNMLALCGAWALLLLARRRQVFTITLAAHTFVAAWLVWFAFPQLGELI
jgi:hypothetical protein